MTSIIHSLLLITAVFLWIMCIGFVFIIIGCAILFACKVTQKIHKKSEEAKKDKILIKESSKNKGMMKK